MPRSSVCSPTMPSGCSPSPDPAGSARPASPCRPAAELRGSFADGIVFVSLDPIVDPALVPVEIARAFGVREAGHRPVPDRLRQALAPVGGAAHPGQLRAGGRGGAVRRRPPDVVPAIDGAGDEPHGPARDRRTRVRRPAAGIAHRSAVCRGGCRQRRRRALPATGDGGAVDLRVDAGQRGHGRRDLPPVGRVAARHRAGGGAVRRCSPRRRCWPASATGSSC